jgi:glycosyltransferase involved in cell wall biosynthesis
MKLINTRIAHVLSSFGMGGQERVAYDLAISQQRAGCRVTVLSLAPEPDGPLAAELVEAGIAIDRVARPRPGLDPMLVVRIARWLRQHRIDLVHTHNRMALIYGAPAGKLARCKVVHTKHGNNPKGGTRLVAGNLAGRCVDAFVAVSPETAAFARKRREVDLRKLLVIDNGIELGRFHPRPEAREHVRASLAIPQDAPVIGTVGRIAAEKNHALLVRAVAPLLGPAHLVIAGDGPLMPDLKAAVASSGAADHIHLLGVRRDVPDVLNAFDVFALSSDTEGLPLSILEAMATGLPVLSTIVGGVPNVIDDGQTGWLVPRGDEAALREQARRALADLAATRATGARARTAAVERFSAARMQREYLALYARVLAPEPWYREANWDVRDRRSV